MNHSTAGPVYGTRAPHHPRSAESRRPWHLDWPRLLHRRPRLVRRGLLRRFHSPIPFADSNGATVGASPWYAQGFLAPVLVLFARSAPRWLAVLQTLIWFWIFTRTWVAKLIPWYAGYRGRATVPALSYCTHRAGPQPRRLKASCRLPPCCHQFPRSAAVRCAPHRSSVDRVVGRRPNPAPAQDVAFFKSM